jgi:hypothetical protein
VPHSRYRLSVSVHFTTSQKSMKAANHTAFLFHAVACHDLDGVLPGQSLDTSGRRLSFLRRVNTQHGFCSPVRPLTFTSRKLSGCWCRPSAATSSTPRQWPCHWIGRETSYSHRPTKDLAKALLPPLAMISGTQLIGSMAPPFFFYLIPLISTDIIGRTPIQPFIRFSQ